MGNGSLGSLSTSEMNSDEDELELLDELLEVMCYDSDEAGITVHCAHECFQNSPQFCRELLLATFRMVCLVSHPLQVLR